MKETAIARINEDNTPFTNTKLQGYQEVKLKAPARGLPIRFGANKITGTFYYVTKDSVFNFELPAIRNIILNLEIPFDTGLHPTVRILVNGREFNYSGLAKSSEFKFPDPAATASHTMHNDLKHFVFELEIDSSFVVTGTNSIQFDSSFYLRKISVTEGNLPEPVIPSPLKNPDQKKNASAYIDENRTSKNSGLVLKNCNIVTLTPGRRIHNSKISGNYYLLNNASTLLFELASIDKVLLKLTVPLGTGFQTIGRIFVNNIEFHRGMIRVRHHFTETEVNRTDSHETKQGVRYYNFELDISDFVEKGSNSITFDFDDLATISTSLHVNDICIVEEVLGLNTDLKTKQNQAPFEHETYDTSDPKTKAELLTKLSAIKTGRLVNTSGGTKQNPVEIRAGIVFCDFIDIHGGDLENEYNILKGPNNELIEFIARESNGTARLILEKQPNWIRLQKSYKEYENKAGVLIEDLDKDFDFPDHWQIVFLAFPNKFKDTKNKGYETEQYQNVFTSSHCSYDVKLDYDKNTGNTDIKNLIFIDPNVYREILPVNVMIHELLHGLSLPDLYNLKVDRSYGWSIMSNGRYGHHLLGFEKLLLGWETFDNYVFLKSGKTQVDIEISAVASGKKGIIVLPGNNESSEYYFMEVAQEIGNTENNKKEFAKNGPGLLVMVLDTSLRQGSISPFVNKLSQQAEMAKYGGACDALFYPGERYSTNGITWKVLSKKGDNKLSCEFEVKSDYKSADKAQVLRENERIRFRNNVFRINMIGELCFGSRPVTCSPNIIETTNQGIRDYGICAFVDRNGAFHIASATNVTNTAEMHIVKTYKPGNPRLVTDGDYFFKLETTVGKPVINIYKGKMNDSKPTYVYTLFE